MSDDVQGIEVKNSKKDLIHIKFASDIKED